MRNVVHEVPYAVSRLSPSQQGRQTLQASVIHRSSIDNGQPDTTGQSFGNNLPTVIHTGVLPTLPTLTQSPRSPSSADILEVMPLYPRPQASSNQVTNVYQVRDFKREHNNNQADTAADHRHAYTNDFNRDLAMLRNTLRQETALNTIRDIEEETHFLERRYVSENAENNPAIAHLSPTLSNSSEHYAQLSIQQQEPSRLYVNVAPNDTHIFNANKNEAVPSTPLTPKQVEYCNLTIGKKTEINTYANLMLGDMTDSAQNCNQFFGKREHNQKFSESDTFTSMSPVEDINYAILDIDSSKDSIKTVTEVASPESQSYNSSKNESTTSYTSQSRGRVVSQSSIDRSASANASNPAPSASIGYTTIDFDKTVALTSVAAGAEVSNMDGSRQNRLNSCSMLSGSPSNADKSRVNN